jgi:hypothetical protein
MQHIAPLTSQASPLLGRYVTIVKHHRRSGSTVGTVRDVFWKGDEPWIVVQLTSGRQMAVAYSWTDLPPETCPTPNTAPELLPSGLVAMATYCRGLQVRRRTRHTTPPRTAR